MKQNILCAAVLVATAFAAFASSRVSAQIPGVGLTLVPKAGLYKPLGDLATGYRIDNHLAIGLAAEIKLPLLPLGIRANLDHTTGADITVAAGTRAAATTRAGTVALTNIVGDLLLRPLPSIIPVQPYLFAGGGVKKYSFRDFQTANFNSDDNRSDPTLHVGAGVGLGIGLLGLVVEGGDYISRFKFAGDTKLQNDVYATLGIKVGLL